MSERGLHTIADDLSETWIEDWAAVGLAEMETLLAKHAAFLGYLETIDEIPKNVIGRVRKDVLRSRGLGADAWDREAHGYVLSR